MTRLVHVLVAAAALTLTTSQTIASFIELSVPERFDYAFDRAGILYITAGSEIRRYDTTTQSFLPSFEIGGQLRGVDLSPDGSTLAVADGAVEATTNRIHLVDVATGAATAVSFVRGSAETGTYMTAWGSDGRVLTTSTFSGSGWVPLRRYDPATGTTTTLRSVRQNTMLTASADRHTIGMVEANISSGPVLAYDVALGDVVATVNTGWFTFEVGVSRDGRQFVVPTYNGAYIYDRDGSTFTYQDKLGQYASHGPISAVFAPLGDFLFTAEYDWSGVRSGVKVYDATTWEELERLDTYNFSSTGNFAMGPGRLGISPDGRWLAVSVADGVRLYDVSAYIPEPNMLVTALGGMCLLLRRRRALQYPPGLS